MNEVTGPEVVQTLLPQPDARTIVHPVPTLIGLHLRDLEPFLPPNSFDHCPLITACSDERAFVIYMSAAVAQHSGDHAISSLGKLLRNRLPGRA